jgi:hypothetical protein
MTPKIRKLVWLCAIAIFAVVNAHATATTKTSSTCVTSEVSYTGDFTGSFYTWSGIPGSSVAQKIAGGTSTQNWVTLKWVGGSGTYTFSVNVNGNTTTFVVTVNNSATISGPTQVVLSSSITGASAPLTTPVTFTSDAGKTGYDWTFSGPTGTISGADGSSSSTVTYPQATGSADFGGTVSIIYTSGGTCNYKQRGVTIVNQPKVSGPTSSSTCTEQTYTVPAVGIGYTWTVSNGTLIDLQGSNSMRVRWGTGSSGTVHCKIRTRSNGSTDWYADSNTLSVSLTPVLPSLTATDGKSLTTWCANAARTFSTDAGMSSYVWKAYLNGSNSSYASGSTQNFNFTVLPGSTRVTVSYNNGTCPTGTRETTMTVATPGINYLGTTAPANLQLCYGNTYSGLHPYTTDSGYSNYSWTPSAGSVSSGQGTSSASIAWPSSGSNATLTLAVSYLNSTLGCTSTRTINAVDMYNPYINGTSTYVIGNVNPQYSTKLDAYTVSSSYAWSITPTSSGSVSPASGSSSTTATWLQTGTINVSYSRNFNGTQYASCAASKAVTVGGGRLNTRDLFADEKQMPSADPSMSFYPNPADKEVTVLNARMGSSISILSATGIEVTSELQDAADFRKKIDISFLPEGIYFIKAYASDNSVKIQKVIFKH